MAYVRNWFLPVFALSAFDLIGTGIAAIVAYVLETATYLFKPDAAASLALDRLGHEAAAESIAPKTSRFKAFIARALSHDEYSTAGGFAA